MVDAFNPHQDRVDGFTKEMAGLLDDYSPAEVDSATTHIITTQQFFPKVAEFLSSLRRVRSIRAARQQGEFSDHLEVADWRVEFGALMGWLAGKDLLVNDYRWLIPRDDPYWTKHPAQRPALVPEAYLLKRLGYASEESIALMLRVVEDARSDLKTLKLDQAAKDMRFALESELPDPRRRPVGERLQMVEARADVLRAMKKRGRL